MSSGLLSYRQVGPLYVEWGDGLLVHIGRQRPLIFSLRVRLKRRAW